MIDIASRPCCGALPCDWCNAPDDLWQPISSMPEGKWVFVYVAGVSGSGFEAMKISSQSSHWPGRIVSLQAGKEVHKATHWRPAFIPPRGAKRSDNSLYVGD